jgi:hypothetical protein
MTAAKMTTGVLVGMLLLVCGCGDKLTYQRWQSVQDGASKEQVKDTLGEPFQQTEGTWVYQDAERNITSMVFFQNDQVVSKRWASPKHGIQGKSPCVVDPSCEDSPVKMRESE